MALWRAAVFALLALLIGPPMLGAVVQALSAGAPSWAMAVRLGPLTANTAALALASAAITVPLGVTLAVLVTRTDLPGAAAAFALLLVPLVIPLPLWLSGWLLVAGGATLDPLALAARALPWMPGLGPAILLHSLAALPWVVLIVSRGLLAVERDLEEDASLIAPPWWVITWVTLPHARLAILAAAGWVVVQTSTEILIADLFQVRTFAEEVYTQHTVPGPSGATGRAVLASLGFVAVVVALVALWAARAEPLRLGARPPLRFPLGAWRWPAALAVFAVALLLAGVPLGSLLARADVRSYAAAWRGGATLLAANLAVAALVGALAASLALLASWAAGARWRVLVIAVAAAAWALPGPVIGLAMKDVWKASLEALGWPAWLAGPLWNGPSYLPVAWVMLIRVFPFALAVVDPAVRSIPSDLHDAARLDGVGPWGELRWLVWPLTRRAWLVAAWAGMVIGLGELSAAKLVSTPGAETVAEMVFSQLHYGISPELAATCLLLAGAVLATTPLLLVRQPAAP